MSILLLLRLLVPVGAGLMFPAQDAREQMSIAAARSSNPIGAGTATMTPNESDHTSPLIPCLLLQEPNTSKIDPLTFGWSNKKWRAQGPRFRAQGPLPLVQGHHFGQKPKFKAHHCFSHSNPGPTWPMNSFGKGPRQDPWGPSKSTRGPQKTNPRPILRPLSSLLEPFCHSLGQQPISGPISIPTGLYDSRPNKYCLGPPWAQ
ncbi:hypothetical protein E3N88_22280 [Mikania micrantha]|uniref:Uncharacterized protein n=1 Tax=Mikania micrantha TaxID=192012 RepID=A0A5N6NB47_9ASTR|nr:hypothetical protein E3N88_22280 [Mikania micrantha]